MSYAPKISPNLLTPDNHALILIDYESQMLFPLKSINTGEFRDNVGIVAGASRIFQIPTVVTTVAEDSFSGPVFPEIEEFYPKASSGYIDRTSMNVWEDEKAYNAIVGKGRKKIVFAGLWTSVCIVDPVLCAITEGFDTYIISDACGDVSSEAHERAMNRMVQLGATPMTSIQYLLELQRDWARGETYAAVTGLVQKYGGSYGIGIQYAQRMHAH
jgi:nicotinamidase-related amidase